MQLFYSNTVAVRSLKDLGLRDAVDADSMANYALSDAFELANAGESEVNAYKAWIQANGKDALQKSIAEKRALISAKTENYQKDNISIGYPVVSGLTDSAQQEKLNAHLKENALSPIEALLSDATKDKLTVTAEVISADADRVVVVYRGEM